MKPLIYLVYNEYEPDYVQFDALYYDADRAQARCDELNEESEGRNPWDYTSLVMGDA